MLPLLQGVGVRERAIGRVLAAGIATGCRGGAWIGVRLTGVAVATLRVAAFLVALRGVALLRIALLRIVRLERSGIVGFRLLRCVRPIVQPLRLLRVGVGVALRSVRVVLC